MTQKRQVVLPYELERDIFELAAKSFPGYGLKLSTLCKYVQEWMEALIYETVVLELPLTTTQLFMRTFDSRPASFFAKTVRRLYITSIVTFDDAQRLLKACTGVTDITCWVYPHNFEDRLLPLLPTRALRRLSITLEALWGITERSIQFDPTLFPNLSHLEIVNPPGLYPTLQLNWDSFVALPSLTHLALGELCYNNHSHFIPFFEKVLDDCPHLKVLVLVSRDKNYMDALNKAGVDSDSRVVVQPNFNGPVTITEYWKDVRQGGPDFWTRAESLVPVRRNLISSPAMSHQNLIQPSPVIA